MSASSGACELNGDTDSHCFVIQCS